MKRTQRSALFPWLAALVLAVTVAPVRAQPVDMGIDERDEVCSKSRRLLPMNGVPRGLVHDKRRVSDRI